MSEPGEWTKTIKYHPSKRLKMRVTVSEQKPWTRRHIYIELTPEQMDQMAPEINPETGEPKDQFINHCHLYDIDEEETLA